jgi:leucyl aminopeptidase (aminopeptidase T)
LSFAAFAQQPDYDQLAKRIVQTSAAIKPGEVVIISGGKHNLALMESLTIEANKAGGLTNMFITTDRVDRSFNVDVPEKYLDQEPRYFAEWIKQVDVFIGLPGEEDPKAVIAGVPEARFARAAKAAQATNEMIMNGPKLRGVFIDLPTRQDAALLSMDFSAYSKILWDAVNADYSQIAMKAKAMQEALRGAKSVHITSPDGTDLTFAMGDRAVFADDGTITPEKLKNNALLGRFLSLPGGYVFSAPLEASANGKVAVPKVRCRFEPMTGVTFEVHAGKMQNFKAAQNGGCFVETMAPYDGPKDMFASISIGLNPAMKVIEEGAQSWRPDKAAGLVYLGFGDNQMMGGMNKTSGGSKFPIVNSTVTVDGKVIVKDGKLI